jgi:minor extracellular serine protease Vpr
MALDGMKPGMARRIGGGLAPIRRFSAEVLSSEQVVPVVLEFVQPPVEVYKRLNPQADAALYEAELAKVHREFLDHLAKLGIKVQVATSPVVVAAPQGQTEVEMPHDFTRVFNGLGVLMPGRMVAQVAAMAGLRAVTLNRERLYLNLDKSVPFTGAVELWNRSDAAGKNLKGEGIVVAVIDTGVDWTHPAFGGHAKAPNEKVVHAVSLTGEAPIDNFGHGTHVAAIIAGDADYRATPRGDSKLAGMAPKAQIMGYKVLTAAGSGSATNIILAMEDAVKRGVDVMNLSLGDSYGDPLAPECSAANNAMLAGVVVCVAAGNAGPERSSVGAPGAAHHVITVGASTDPGVTALVAHLGQEGQPEKALEMRLLDGSVALPTPAMELPFVACAMGAKPADFPAEVRGKIALVQRGDVTFIEKAKNAQEAGAAAVVIYNNRDGNFFGSLGEEANRPSIPVVALAKADGESMLQAGKSARLRLTPEEVAQPDRMAEFSSRGPNNDLWIKPELTAPGVNIDSATITQAAMPGGGMPDPSGYISASGTSMATPHVAGAVALIRQAHPDWTPMQIKAALVNTARWMQGQGSVMDQGNGAMDLIRAIDCQAVLVTATSPVQPTHSFGQVVHEGTQKVVSQALTVQPLTEQGGKGPYKLAVEVAGSPQGLQAELTAATVACSVEGCLAGFELKLTVDGKVLPDGAYYGFVTAEAEWGALRMPFYLEASRQARKEPPTPANPTEAPPRNKGLACR